MKFVGILIAVLIAFSVAQSWEMGLKAIISIHYQCTLQCNEEKGGLGLPSALCDRFTNALYSQDSTLFNNTFIICYWIQWTTFESCNPADIPAETETFVGELCSSLTGGLAQLFKSFPPLAHIFQPPNGPAYKYCERSLDGPVEKAVTAACHNGTIQSFQICPEALCGGFNATVGKAFQLLGCPQPFPPAICKQPLNPDSAEE